MPRPGAGLIRLLAERGVPERAARLYIASCREGAQTAAELARMSGIHRVEAYRHIQQLREAGLLRSVSGRPMRFAALAPEELVERWVRTATEDVRRLEENRGQILREFREQIATPEAEDGRKFAILERRSALYSFLKKRIGLARRELLLSLSPKSLARLVDGGVDRELRLAHRHGVRVRLVTEITRANLLDAKHFGTFAEVRHVGTVPSIRGILLDRRGAVVYVAGDHAPTPTADRLVTLWTTDEELLQLLRHQFGQLWNHGTPADQRIVELEEPPVAALPVRLGREVESFNRLREITQLGMQVGALRELPFDLPEFIDTVAHQVGRQIANQLDGELPAEVARSLQEYFRDRGVSFEILRPEPLLVRTTNCLACDGASPEVGRLLCPAILRTVFEARTGARWDVTDGRRSGRRGHVFSLTPS